MPQSLMERYLHLSSNNTVDGRNPAPVDSLCHYLQGFLHPRWCRISSINSSSRGPGPAHCFARGLSGGCRTWLHSSVRSPLSHVSSIFCLGVPTRNHLQANTQQNLPEGICNNIYIYIAIYNYIYIWFHVYILYVVFFDMCKVPYVLCMLYVCTYVRTYVCIYHIYIYTHIIYIYIQYII